ncbi:MAG TPA: O-antigen ligase family protein [Methanoregulaceae archaeon]|nr:O-antigen ligase family protein [Methanoregulaceae archaeon]
MKSPKDKSIDYPHVSAAVVLLFCGYVVCWYLQIGHRVPFLGKIRFEFIYAALLIALAFFSTGLSNLRSPLLKYLVLLFVCFVIAIPFSYDFQTSWNVFVDRVVKFAFMAVFIAAFVKSPRHMKFFLAAFMLACLKMGEEGFVGKITGGLIWENQGVMRLHGATPIYEHPNSFAGMALGTVPFIYYLFPIAPKWAKAILVVMMGFAINIILFTGSRTGYVAFFFFVVFAFFMSNAKKKFALYAIALSLVSVPLVPQDYVGRFSSIFTGEDKEGRSTELRKEILKDACKIFIAHPLGVGVAAFPAVRRATFGRSQDTHNLYLEVATNLGIQGLIIFLMFIYQMMKTLLGITRGAFSQLWELEELARNIRAPSDAQRDITNHIEDLKLIRAVGSAVFMFMIIRLALGLFGMDLYEIYWWFALGLTIALYNMSGIAQEKTENILRSNTIFLDSRIA